MKQKPKYDDGNFTILPNELLETLAKHQIGSAQSQCLWVIIRKTFGWRKDRDGIPLSQFYQATGIEKRNVIRCLKELEKRKIIVLSSENKRWKTYRINKKYKNWKKAEKRQNSKNSQNSEKVLTSEKEIVLSSENIRSHRKNLKRKYTKKIKTKESAIDQKNKKCFSDYRLTEKEKEERLALLRQQAEEITK